MRTAPDNADDNHLPNCMANDQAQCGGDHDFTSAISSATAASSVCL
jgi:hypothetical protein